MNLQINTMRLRRPQNGGEAGFSLLGALVFVLFVAFVAAGAMHLIRYRYAALGFVVAVILALIIASLPDIRRYIKISSM